MARMIRSGLIQMSLPKTEGEGTIPEIINAMVQKHIPLLKKQEKKVFRFFVCRKFLTLLIFVRAKTKNGMNLQNLFPVRRLN